MTLYSVGQIDRLYAYSAGVTISYERVEHELFRRFSLGLRQFKHSLGEQASDPFWGDFLRVLSRYQFWLSSAPLGFNNDGVRPTIRQDRLDDFLSRIRFVYPARAGQAKTIVDDLTQLVSCPDNPLLDGIEALTDAGSLGGVVVILETRLLPLAREALQSRVVTRRVDVVTLDELRDINTFERLILLGAAQWYPDHVFTAPRAPKILVLSHRWVRSRWRPRIWLIGANQRSQPPWGGEPTDEGETDPDEGWPGIDWAALERRASAVLAAAPGEEQDEVQARLLALHGGQAVLLEEQEGATSLVIDLREDETARVTRVCTSELEPGMFVLLRTEGGGDYIVPVADLLLGERAVEHRQAQREWKLRLRTFIQENDIGQVARWLRELGAVRADETNLRHWASDRGIATQDRGTFAAIMRLLHSEKDTDRYWGMMRTIRAAHLSAGMAIRKRLLQQVKIVDLARLRREGRFDFTLPKAEGGKLTALRVEARAPNTTLVPASRTGRVFERPD